MTLKGKTAIITGGGTGIGAAIAARFVADGARVCITGRRENVLDEMIKSLPDDKIVKCQGDVTNPSDIERIIETTLDFGGTVNVLVNNAGVGTEGSITGASIEEWRKTVELNLVAPFMLMRAVIPHMIKVGGGSIVNISSLASLRSIPLGSAYCTSKAGLNMLTQQAALDYGGDGIRCNAICPGFVFSDMVEEHFGQVAKDLGTDLKALMAKVFQDIPSHQPANPDKIAGICSFLAGDDSGYITGTVIPVDGGLAVMDPFPLCVKNAELQMGK
ncbi:MAG: SDR family oxidoreductase [Desulfobacteraceae bacterium]|jgi:NAD(P)-dependent dehydrogenase (short-subunit alcohol dehydrogenase family)